MKAKFLTVFLVAIVILSPLSFVRAESSTPGLSVNIKSQSDGVVQQLMTQLINLQRQLIEVLQNQTSSGDTSLYPLTVTYPNGEEIFVEGETVHIAWSPVGPTATRGVSSIELVSTDGGKDLVLFSKQVANHKVDYDGHFAVKLPKPTDSDGENTYKVRITAPDGETDMSDTSFVLESKE